MNNKLKRIIRDINTEIENTFPVKKIAFAVIFGSWARNENSEKSDIDLLVVFENNFDFHKSVVSFKQKFIKIQCKYGLNIDYKYPGEYISTEKLDKSLKGYGFIINHTKMLIPNISRNEWDNFNEYRQWLSALATPNQFIYGNKKKYESYKEHSLISLIKIFLLSRENPIKLKNTSSALITGGKEFLGFCNTTQTKAYLKKELSNIYKKLINTGFVSKNNSDELKVNRYKIINSLTYVTNKNTSELRKKFVGDLLQDDDKKILNKSLDIGLDFMLDDKEVLQYYPEKDIKKRFEGDIPKIGIPLNKIVDEFKKNVIRGSIHQSSPKYLAFPDSGNSISALTASILESFINQNLIATIKSAPTGTYVEMQVIRWLRNLVGFPNSNSLPKNALGLGGFVTSCGTLSNTTALLVARCKTFPKSRRSGLQKEKVKPILIVASDTLNHYSHIASFWWLGLGEDNIIFVKPNSDFRFNTQDLENKIMKNNDGIKSKVVAVIILAGDSRTTTIENLEHISKITKKHKVWLHVDACHGGILIFSKKHKNKIKGIENADSISIDPHKSLGVPYSSSVILFKNIKHIKLISKATDITIQSGSFDLGQITPFLGSKPFDSLKLWFLIKHLGLDGIDKLINYRLKLAKDWSRKIAQSAIFEPMNEPDLNSVVFSISLVKVNKLFPKKCIRIIDVPKLNKKIHDSIYKKGKICIHNFDIFDVKEKIFPSNKKVRVLGVTLGNPYTSTADFNNYISYIENVAKNVIDKYDNYNYNLSRKRK